MVTGGLAVVTVLALVIADTVHPGVSLALEDKILLVSMASALLGIDFAIENIPIELIIQDQSTEDSSDDSG